jgi:heat shock protein HslJ
MFESRICCPSVRPDTRHYGVVILDMTGGTSSSWGDAFADTRMHDHSVATLRSRFPRFGLVAVLLVLGGCSTDEGDGTTAASPTETPSVSLEGPTWELSAEPAPGSPLDGIVVTARFEDGTMSGESGCNTYTTSYEVDGTSLTIGSEIAGTTRACPPAETAVERAYLARLPQVSSYRISGSTLTLLNGDEALLRYDATIAAEAILGDWIVTSYFSGDAITSVLGGVDMTTTFAAPDVTGNTGCNTFNGPYQVAGDEITIGPLTSTRAACPTEELQQQETDFLAALSLATTFRVTANRLDLLRPGETIAATFVRA